MSKLNKLVFVVGASRSGTTMMSRILGRHSDLLALNELHVFGDLITIESLHLPISRAQQKELVKSILLRQEHGIWGADREITDPEKLNKVMHKLSDGGSISAANVFEKTMEIVAEDDGSNTIIEQTPRNIFYAQALLETYPHAYFVHMVRDPRAVLASQKNKWRRKFLGGDRIPFLEVLRMWVNYHPFTLSKLWIKSNGVATRYQSADRFFVIKFEELLESPKNVLASLSHDLGIDFQPTMLEVDHVGSSHQHNAKPVSGISNSTAESWRESLTPAEQLISEKLCSATMKEYGYVGDFKKAFPLGGMLILLIRFPIHIFGVVLFNFKRAVIQLKSLFVSS